MEVLYPRAAGLDVHKDTVVACVRIMEGGKVTREVRSFATTTAGLLDLAAWLSEHGITHVAMEATGVYWKPVWNILNDGEFVAQKRVAKVNIQRVIYRQTRDCVEKIDISPNTA